MPSSEDGGPHGATNGARKDDEETLRTSETLQTSESAPSPRKNTAITRAKELWAKTGINLPIGKKLKDTSPPDV